MTDTRSSPASERPGITSSYTVESFYPGAASALTVGLILTAAKGTGEVEEFSSLGELKADHSQEERLLSAGEILFRQGIAQLFAAVLPQDAGEDGYKAAIHSICGQKEVEVVVCDSADSAILGVLKERIHADSLIQREKVAFCAQSDPKAAASLAQSLNSERMMVVAGEGLAGGRYDGLYSACALAGLFACTGDPSANLSGSALLGLSGLKAAYSEEEIQTMLSQGATPLEVVGGQVECIKPVSTRTLTEGVPDRTWHSLSTIMTIDFCMRRLREMLKTRLKGAKNNLATRESIRSQVWVELSSLCSQGILDDFGPVQAYPSPEDPGICLVDVSFKVSGVMERIHLSAHITIS